MTDKSKFAGVTTALITPFKNGKVDFDSLQRLIKSQMESGIESFVVNGTTAESPTLSEDESIELLQYVKQKFPTAVIIFGAGSNSTMTAINLSRLGEENGAHALLSVVPYYNKPTQEGLFQHFKAIAEATTLPVILYNVPGRTITSFDVETVVRLSAIKNIVGIKEASGNMEYASRLRKAVKKEFLILSGDDSSFNSFMELGGDGIISVCSHLIPQTMRGVWLRQKDAVARFKTLIPLIDKLYLEPNPVPTKFALSRLKLIDSFECRLPLVALSSLNQTVIANALGELHD